MEKLCINTVEFSKTFARVISQIVNKCTENSLFGGKLGQKGKFIFK